MRHRRILIHVGQVGPCRQPRGHTASRRRPTNGKMKLRIVATSAVNLIGGAAVAVIIGRLPSRRIAIRSRRLRIPLAPRIGGAGGNGLNGRNEEEIPLPPSCVIPLWMRVFFASSPRLGPQEGLSVRLNATRIHSTCVLSSFEGIILLVLAI